jgi:N-acetylglutamate synthase-like GNAT family acetyltransferase
MQLARATVRGQFDAPERPLTTNDRPLPCRAMPKPDNEIVIAEDGPEVGHDIDAGLLHSLRKNLPQARNTNFVLSAREQDATVIGGLTAGTSYGWLLVKTLWVAESCRHRGTGRRLMARAEVKGRSLGCHGAWLDTSSPKAKEFYAKLGYKTFGQLINSAEQHPASHRRWFMEKKL